jgi:hypothetical protein
MTEAEVLRAKIAAAQRVGLTLELIERIKGETVEDIERDAENFATALGQLVASKVRRDARGR